MSSNFKVLHVDDINVSYCQQKKKAKTKNGLRFPTRRYTLRKNPRTGVRSALIWGVMSADDLLLW